MLGMNIIAGIVSSGIQYLSEGRKIKTATRERKDELSKLSLETKLEAIKNADESAMQMDKDTEVRIPWADDVSFTVFLLPAVFAFCPLALPHIQAGFLALANMPVWYQYALGLMLVRVWGYRQLVDPIVKMLAKAYLGKATKTL